MSENTMEDCIQINTGESVDEDSSNRGTEAFDEIIGHIEDLLLEDEFHGIQHKFLENHWSVFEPTEENKLIYTDIFNEYNKTVENYLVDYLRKVIPHFDMNTLLTQLSDRHGELEGEVFEVLSTITDFVAFKEMVLDYRAMKEGKIEDLSCGISITSLKTSNSHNDEPPR